MKVFFVSLGCDKNLSDSEHMLYLMRRDGMEITDQEKEADIIIVNTCCFIESALEESINTIIEMGKYKTEGNARVLLVTGCMAERYKAQIEEDLPEVDGIVGTNSYTSIVEAIHKTLEGQKVAFLNEKDSLLPEPRERVLTTGGHFAYLKIAEGCNKNCSYCIIPSLRGHYRSVPMEQIYDEAVYLVSQGVKELILVAQETTLYGLDLYQKKMLPELLHHLSEIEGLEWIRILYCYPEEITDALIQEMKNNRKVCHYIDMPIQHSSDHVLKNMGRKTTEADLREIVSKLREEIPDIAIRTTLICGFPGETDKEHHSLLTFVDEMKFDRLGAFCYSREENTRAYSMPMQITETEKNKRRDAVMALQQQIAFQKNQQLEGTTIRAMIEGYMPEDNVYVGRTYRDAPDVDGMIFLSQADREYNSGDFVMAKVTGYHDYDLTGDIL